MKVKHNYIKPKVEIIPVELENCFIKIFPDHSKKQIKKDCNSVSDSKQEETNMLPS